MAYVDTNVIVSRYLKNDPFKKKSEKFFAKKPDSLYITALSVAELHSVFSRVGDKIEVSKEVKIEMPEALSTLVAFAVKHCGLTLISVPYTVLVSIGNLNVRASVEQAISYSLAPKLKLRTLDLLHLALCYVLRMQGRLDTFITIDGDIHSSRDVIKQETGVKVKHLNDIVTE